MSKSLSDLLRERFGETFDVPEGLEYDEQLRGFAGHRSHRRFDARAVDESLVRTLLACAFSAPAKSDLQQSSAVRVTDPVHKARLAEWIPSMSWIADAPLVFVFCGDNRRIRRICEMRGKPFGNDHLDSFFNAAVDTGLVMMSFIRAAQGAGLGCCPISAVRNHAAAVSEMLELPAYVFPVAGLVAGYPAGERKITPRLPLDAFVHDGRFDDGALEAWVDEYDRRRHAVLALDPSRQRSADEFADVEFYGWSEDKARQVSVTERETFGDYIRTQGFKLD